MTDYNSLMERYLLLRHEIQAIEARGREEVKKRRVMMEEIEGEITRNAREEGLETVPTTCGTGYWSTSTSARVGSPADFQEYVKANEAWDLVDMRASRTGVKTYVENHGEPPPGINYSSYIQFKVREA